MAGAPWRFNFIRQNIHATDVRRVLKRDSEQAVEKMAKEIMMQIKDIYPTDRDGNPINWKVVTYYGNRKSRLYTAIVADSPYVRYAEAKHGSIRRKIRTLTKKNSIRVQWDGNGFRLI